MRPGVIPARTGTRQGIEALRHDERARAWRDGTAGCIVGRPTLPPSPHLAVPRPLPSRRAFLAESGRTLSTGVLALELPWVAALAACARDDARAASPFKNLTPAEARTMRAFAAQILPADGDLPSAEEAGALYFVDRALVAPQMAGEAKNVRAGLADLDTRARGAGGADFAALSPASQIAVMKAVEKTPFFGTARMLVVAGTFADPSYGGNRDMAGARIAGIEHAASFHAPFGWYDAPDDGGGKLA